MKDKRAASAKARCPRFSALSQTCRELTEERPLWCSYCAPDQRGFAVMSAEKQRLIASRGGKAAHRHGRAYEWDKDSAAAAGRKGGLTARGGRGKLVVQPEAAAS